MGKRIYLLTFLLLTLFIASCGTEAPQELQFETIEQVNVPGSIKQRESPEPGLLIIAHSEEIEEVKRFITDEAALALSQLNFSTHFAIVAFRGRQPTSHKDFRVEHIARQGNEIIINAQAGQRGGDDMVTSPYHLVKVRKDGKWDRTFTFNLYFDGDQPTVASVSHYVQ